MEKPKNNEFFIAVMRDVDGTSFYHIPSLSEDEEESRKEAHFSITFLINPKWKLIRIAKVRLEEVPDA